MNQNQPAIEVDNIPNGAHGTHRPIRIQTPIEIDNTLNDILKDVNKRPTHVRRQNVYMPVIKNHANQSVYPSNNIQTNKKRNTRASYMKSHTP